MEIPHRDSASPPRRDLRGAILWMVAAALAFAVMGALVKAATAGLSFLSALWARAAVGLVFLSLWMRAVGRRRDGRRRSLLLLRSLFGWSAMFLYFFAIERLPLSTATVLNYASPLFVALLSGRVLREGATWRLVPWIGLALGGLVLLVGAVPPGDVPAAALGLASALLAALAYLVVRRLSATEAPDVIVWHFSAWSVLFATLTFPLAWLAGYQEVLRRDWETLARDPSLLWPLIGVGIAATLGQLAMTTAYGRERAAVVAPYSYLTPLVAYGLGIAWFGDPVAWRSVIGGGMILLASVVLTIRASVE
ncbi:MAG TPA: DMT family transporter [Myxococcota bacterium]|nr:DMT family transporter [Myxococcota bacterium]HQK50988.1 DMT family transporter [Myxococcota bacterium]